MMASSKAQRVLVILLMFSFGCCYLGTLKMVAVCIRQISVSLESTTADMGFAMGMLSACAYCPAPIMAYVYRDAPRGLLVAGAVLNSAGIMLTSCARNNAEFTAALSLAGIGLSALWVSGLVELGKQTQGHVGCNIGLGSAGSPVGMFLIPLIGDRLMATYGWRGAMLIMGGVMGHVIPVALLIRPRRDDIAKCDVENKFPTEERKEVAPITAHWRGTQHKHPTGLDKPGSESPTNCEDDSGLSQDDNDETNEVSDDKKSKRRGLESVPLISPSSGSTTNVHAKGISAETCKGHEDDLFKRDDKETEQSKLSLKHCKKRSFLERTLKGKDRCLSLITERVQVLYESDLYTNPRLTLFIITRILFGITYGGWHSFLIVRAVDRGMSIMQALTLSFSAGVFDILGRIIVGFFTDNFGRVVDTVNFLTALMALSLLCDVLVANYVVTYVTSSLSGFAIAGRAILNLVVVKERASKAYYDVTMSAVVFTGGVGTMLGSYLTGGTLTKHKEMHGGKVGLRNLVDLRCSPSTLLNL